MKLVTLACLLGISLANYVSELNMKLAWKEDFTIDFESLDHVASWFNWKKEFGKEYNSLNEEASKFLTFVDNWKFINDHNVKYWKKETTYKLGLNQFADLTGEEFKLYVHGPTGSCMKTRSVSDRIRMEEITLDIDAPDSIDWRNYNGGDYVTPVKNQGQCGSCWAFSTTGSIESRSAIKNQQTGSSIVELSEQQLVDCSGSYGNDGCNGGLMDNAFKYVEKTGGLCSETEYKYTARNGACKSTTCGTFYDPITGYTDVTADSETSLEAAVAEGPVSIAIEADQSAFQFYSGGILSGNCGTRLDHGVLAVGYGAEGTQEYWIVKNSWGASWGESGYVRICRNCDKNGNKGECGILMEPSYPAAK